MIQLFGSGFGQEASTVKVGISPAEAGEENAPSAAAMQKQTVPAKRASARARTGVGVIESSQEFCYRLLPLGAQSIAVKEISQRFAMLTGSHACALRGRSACSIKTLSLVARMPCADGWAGSQPFCSAQVMRPQPARPIA